VLADVQRNRGFSAIVVRSEQGLDEISTEGITHVWDATTHEVRHELFQAEHLGLMPASLSDLRGGEAVENAAVVRSVLAGDRTGRLAAIRDVVLVNAAAALVAIDATRETHAYGSPQNSFAARMELAISDAAKSIDSGSAETALANFVEVSQRLADVGA
jgi:anthranilate phosphoribosyltransferase